jgi:hypothetical protein
MPTRERFLDTFHRDVELFTATLRESGELTQPVDGCPEWDLAGLAAHVGGLHRYVTTGIELGDPGKWPGPPAQRSAYADWFADGAAALEVALRARPDAEPCWTFFPNAEQVVGTWVRRQCQEMAAFGTAETIDAEIAKDGVDEYFDLFLGRVDARRPIRVGELTLHLHATDVESGEWFVRCGDHAPVVTREHAKGDVALNGPADQILLALWGRIEPGEMDLQLFGDTADWRRFHEAACI